MPVDEQSYLLLVEKHAKVVSSAIRRVCGRSYGVLGPDIEQEVRIALWQRLQRGKEIEYPVSYLYKMALTTALEAVRKQIPTAGSLDDERTPDGAVTGSGTGSLLPEEKA